MNTIANPGVPIPVGADATLVPEPYLLRTFLPRCAKCHAPHPLARKPIPSDSPTCLECDHPVGTPQTVEVPAPKFGGFWGLIANACFNLGRWLRRRAKEL